jgi:hypothetical protein
LVKSETERAKNKGRKAQGANRYLTLNFNVLQKVLGSALHLPLRKMLHILKIFSRIWFSNDVSQSHVIYHFEKCVTISYEIVTHYLERKFWEPSISPCTYGLTINLDLWFQNLQSKKISISKPVIFG